jgi:superoxide dismutase
LIPEHRLQLVKMKAGTGVKTLRYEIVPTHAAGTLLVRNRLMLGRGSQTDLFRPIGASDESPAADTSAFENSEPVSSGVEGNIDPDHLRITPLACVSLFEHVYLPKYGVNGKEDYVRDWIRHLDWRAIERN